jgi:hypothetical protein
MEITAELARNREKIESSRSKVNRHCRSCVPVPSCACSRSSYDNIGCCVTLCDNLQAAEYSGVADSARRMISAMSRREAQQKFTAVFVLVILVVVTVLLIYYKS